MNAATVRLLLDTLRLGSGRSPEAARAAWARAETTGLLALLAYEGAELWWHRRLAALDVELPTALRAALRSLVHEATISNMRIDAQTQAVTAIFDAADIPWRLIKGQARRAAAIRYPYASARRVSDVDLLVPESAVDAAWQRLLTEGFTFASENPRTGADHHHRPALTDGKGVAVELHTTTARTVSPAEAWRRASEDADPVLWEGRHVVVPSATELVWQALSHAVADGDSGYSLRTFLSVSGVLAETPSIDWARIAARLDSGELYDNDTGELVPRETACRFLGLAAWLAGASIPPALQPNGPADLVPLLRWRAQVLRRVRSRAARERLLDESVRVEARLSFTPSPAGVPRTHQLRRAAATRVARLLYLIWRAALTRR